MREETRKKIEELPLGPLTFDVEETFTLYCEYLDSEDMELLKSRDAFFYCISCDFNGITFDFLDTTYLLEYFEFLGLTRFNKCKFVNWPSESLEFYNGWFRQCSFVNSTIQFSSSSLSGTTFENCYLGGCRINFLNCRAKDCHLLHEGFVNCALGGLDGLNLESIPLACPSEGEFIGWKKVVGPIFSSEERPLNKQKSSDYLIKLLIPADAKRTSSTTCKCRCEKALVLDIEDLTTGEKIQSVINKVSHDGSTFTIYAVGEYVYPDSYDDDRSHECTHGIHFFVDKQQAINYDL